MLKLSSIFLLLFITLGPIKTILHFQQLTAGSEPATLRTAAVRATLAATAVVILLFVVGKLVLEKWGVSLPAVALTGGIILFLLSLQVMLNSPESASPQGSPPQATSGAMLISRLVIPTIITPPGIVSILALSVLSEGNPELWFQILGLLLLIMTVNLFTMLSARTLLAFLTVAGLRVIGWVFAVLQASLGTQVIINSLRRLGALPIQ
jgi:multiple antibiotic resistance protein